MADQTHIKALGEHDYLIRVLEGEDMIEIRVHASQSVLDRLPVDTDENRLIQATVAYLIRRQRADDLPAGLDLDDVAAAYDGYIDEMVAQLSTGTGGR